MNSDTVIKIFFLVEKAWMILCLLPRLLFAASTWTLHELIELPLIFIGAIIGVPLAIAFRQVVPSPITRKPILTAPDWLWLFGNDEDGYASDEARRHYFERVPYFLNLWWWAAIRNPIGNMRFIRSIYPAPVAHKIRFVRGDSFTLTWQGWRHHLSIITTTKVLSIGWKYYPDDALPGADYGWRNHGCGFALRLRDRAPDDTWSNA